MTSILNDSALLGDVLALFEAYDRGHNARIDDERHHQRSTGESVSSSIKRSRGSAVRARDSPAGSERLPSWLAFTMSNGQ